MDVTGMIRVKPYDLEMKSTYPGQAATTTTITSDDFTSVYKRW